jgi:ABC-3C biological conflict system middle component
MIDWRTGSRIATHFLNPALLAMVEATAAYHYGAAGHKRMNWTLSFVVAPLVLHGPTRDVLPPRVSTHLSTWISRQPLLLAGFPARVNSLAPAVRAGLRFGLRHEVIRLNGDSIEAFDPPRYPDGELTVLLRAARFVGRWFAQTDQTSTLFALFGVIP